MSTTTSRALFVTRLGGILAAVGSAVGLGNVWRFPYETGQNGGAAFILIYLACVLFIGTPLMLTEFVIGRATHRNPAGAFRQLAPTSLWWSRVMGWLCPLAVLMVIGFYSVVAGWTLDYTVMAVADQIPDFQTFSSSLWGPLMWLTIFVILNVLILLGGVQKGIERASNILMPLLGLLLVVLCVNSLLLSGAGDGLRFLFQPDFSKITGRTLVSAMGQSFFSISMGIGTLLIYGSYMPDHTKMGKTSLTITLLDTLIAVLSGIVIFPACCTYGVEPDAGPGLAFITLPAVFQQMPGGYVWCIVFFLLLAVAALTSSISMFENPISILQEEFGMSRRKAVVITAAIAEVLALGCGLSFYPGAAEQFSVFGMSLFDLFDKGTANCLMPLGALMMSLFVGWVMDKQLLRDTLTNRGKDGCWYYRPYLIVVRYVAPLAILLIFLSGLGLFD